MDLLSAQDWTDFRNALTDVKDTFLKKPLVLVKRDQRKLAAFHESRGSDLQAVNYTIPGLNVPDKRDDDSKAREIRSGSTDLSEGYVLFDYNVLKNHNPVLIDVNGKCLIIPNKDSLIINGEELTIIGVNLLGPSETDYQLVQVQWKKDLK